MRPWNVNEPPAARSREPRLKSLARKVRDWLDGYLRDASEVSPREPIRNPERSASPNSLTVPGEDNISPAAQEPAGAAWWEMGTLPGPPEHWLRLVGEGAPGLLRSIKEKPPAQVEPFPIGTTSQDVEPKADHGSVPSMVNGKAGAETRLAHREISAKQSLESEAQGARGRSRFKRFERPALTEASSQTRRKEERTDLEAQAANKAEKEFVGERLASNTGLRHEAVARDQALANPGWTKLLKQKLGRVLHPLPGSGPSGQSRTSRSNPVQAKSMEEREARTKRQGTFERARAGFNIHEPRTKGLVEETLPKPFEDEADGRPRAAVVRVQRSASKVTNFCETRANDRDSAAAYERHPRWQVTENLAQRPAVEASLQDRPLSPTKDKPASPRHLPEPGFPSNGSGRDSARRPRPGSEGWWSGEPLQAESGPADPWPELPESQPFALEDSKASLRNAARLRALDAEQRGDR